MWATPRSSSRDYSTGGKTNVSSAYNRSIVSKHQGNLVHSPSKSPTTNLAYRNYVKDVEMLRRELDRKDAPNDKIAQRSNRFGLSLAIRESCASFRALLRNATMTNEAPD